jgi:hypothetical protein
MRPTLPALLALSFSFAGCAASATSARPETKPAPASALRSFGENEAVAIIDGLLRERHMRPVTGWTVTLPARTHFEVDLRLGDTDFGIEWVSAEDRTRDGDLLPAPDPSGQLRLLASAAGAHQRALILVLDHETYRFTDAQHAALAPNLSGAEEYDLHDAEQRLRRDLTDFVEYARSQ